MIEFNGNFKWKERDLEFVRQNYKTMNIWDIAEKLGRSYESIKQRARILGVRKNEIHTKKKTEG